MRDLAQGRHGYDHLPGIHAPGQFQISNLRFLVPKWRQLDGKTRFVRLPIPQNYQLLSQCLAVLSHSGCC